MTAGVTRGSLQKIHDSVEYYSHQVNGVRTLARMTNFLLADEMGLGKSLQALTVAAIDFELGLARRVLVVAPASLKWNWRDEIKQHTSFSWLVLDGTPSERDRQLDEFIALSIDILIVNYEQLRAHLSDLNRMGFDIIIYDEAHYMKNYKSKRTQSCLGLVAKRHMLLTGSPLLNHVNELWPLLHRINPTGYPTYHRFVNRYAVFGGWKNKQITGVKNRHELSAALDEVMVRRLKKDVLDLPEKQYVVIPLELHPLQRALYKEAAEELEITLPDSPTPMELENALTKYLRLKQIANTAAEIEGYEDVSSKLDHAVLMAQQITRDRSEEGGEPGEPLVIFTQFRVTQACLMKRLEEAGIMAFELHGDVPKEKRSDLVKLWGDYRDPDGKAVLVVMLQVGGVGLNMTQANKCIFIDRLYVPKLNEQAEDRLHRIGSDLTKPVQIFILIARKTIEQRINAILQTKRKLFDSLVEESDWKRKLYELLQEEEDEDEAA